MTPGKAEERDAPTVAEAALRDWLERWRALEERLAELPRPAAQRLRTLSRHPTRSQPNETAPDVRLPAGTRARAEALASAANELARRWPTDTPLPADAALIATIPGLTNLHQRPAEVLSPRDAATLMARVAVDAPAAAKGMRKGLRALALGTTAAADDEASLLAFGGLLALGVELDVDDPLLFRLDTLLGRWFRAVPRLAAAGLARNAAARRQLILRGGHEGPALARSRAARLAAWLASGDHLDADEEALLAELADDAATSVWPRAAHAVGLAARHAPDRLAKLLAAVEDDRPPRQRRRSACALASALDPRRREHHETFAALASQRDVWTRAALMANLDLLADDGDRYALLAELLLCDKPPTAVIGQASRALERLALAEHPRSLPLAAALASASERWQLTELREGAARARVLDALTLVESAESGAELGDLAAGRRIEQALYGADETSETSWAELLELLRAQLPTLGELDLATPLAERAEALYRLDDALEQLFEVDSLFSLARRASGAERRTLEAELEHLRSNFATALAQSLPTLAEDDPRRGIVVRGLGRVLDARRCQAGTLRARLDERSSSAPVERFARLNTLLHHGRFDDGVAWRGLVEALTPVFVHWPRRAEAGDGLTAALLALVAHLPAEALRRLSDEQPRLPRGPALRRYANSSGASAPPRKILEALETLAIELPSGPTADAVADVGRCARTLGDELLPLPDRLAALRRYLQATPRLLLAIDDPFAARPTTALAGIIDELSRADELVASLGDPLVGAERVDAVEQQLLGAAHTLLPHGGRLPLGWLLRSTSGPFAAQARQAGARTMVRNPGAEAPAPAGGANAAPAPAGGANAAPAPAGGANAPAPAGGAKDAPAPAGGAREGPRPGQGESDEPKAKVRPGSGVLSKTRRLRGPAGEEQGGPAATPTDVAPGRSSEPGTSLPDGAAPSLADDYELLHPLGAGGLGMVFEGRQRALDRHVAIKFLHPQLAKDALHRQRFAREGQLMARWGHPHIVRVIDFRDSQQNPALVLELIEGQPLSEVPSRPAAEELTTARQIASALAYAHADGVIHRDVCPDNVLLRHDGEALLADFGIAAPATQPRITEGGAVLGRPIYMSPEQLDGQPPTTAMDLYALGLMLYQRLCGEAPFSAETVTALAALKVERRYRRLRERRPELPMALDELIHALLATDPNERPTAAAVEAQLRDLVATCAETTPAETTPAESGPG